MPGHLPREAPGIILIQQADAEILRRQCEASAHSFRDSGNGHMVQLIPLGDREACIRLYGSFAQFTALLHSLRFPDSGWKPHHRFTGWWKQSLMLQPAPERGLLLQNSANGACSLLDIRKGVRQKQPTACPPFRAAPRNPDTLQLLECTSFE